MTLVELDDILNWLKENITQYVDDIALEYFDDCLVDMKRIFEKRQVTKHDVGEGEKC